MKPASPPAEPPKLKLAILPAESDAFPKAATAATESLTKVKLAGFDVTQVSSVSLEVVQLSIECVEPSDDCFAAVGKSLAANRIVFAQIAAGDKKTVSVNVTLFDVDAKTSKGHAEKVFPTEAAAAAGVAELVTEATR